MNTVASILLKVETFRIMILFFRKGSHSGKRHGVICAVII